MARGLTLSTPKAPDGLDRRGRQLWRSVTRAYDLTDAEEIVLSEACQTADLIDRLATRLAGEELLIEGSRGQTTLNPLAAELRQQRDLLARLLSRLALPGEDDEDDAAAMLGRRGAMARWYPRKRAA
jgi:phage terminase small subunit